jgi:hypothetical protein
MTTNPVLTGVGTFDLVFSDKTAGSERRKVGTAPGLPVVLSIKHAPYVDSKTKVKGTRSVVRFDESIVIDAVGTIAPLSAYLVMAIPEGSVDISAAVLRQIKSLVLLLATDTAAADQLGQGQAIFNVKNQ